MAQMLDHHSKQVHTSSMDLSKANQQKAVGEGLALGTVMLRIQEVNDPKLRLEMDFRRAWQDWQYAPYFPLVKVDYARNDLLRILRKSANRKGLQIAWWNGEWPYVPVIESDWSFEDLARSIHESIPATSWMNLVKDWLQSKP